MKKLKELFKKKKPVQQKFIECSTIDEFKKRYLMYLKQDCALEDNRSYFDVATSNMDGTLFGEQFDNGIRLKFMEKDYPEWIEELGGKDALMEIARAEYKHDIEKVDIEKKDEQSNESTGH